MRRSRISDLERAPLQLSSYLEWLHTLSEELDRHSGDTGAEVLRRFADFVPAPSASQASHLLFELEGFFQDFAPAGFESDWEPPFADSFQVAACEVGADGSFSCQIGDETISGKIRYRGGRFQITSADLSKLFERKEEADTTDTAKAATRLMRSGLRIVTTDGLLYANHRFYSPRTYPWGKHGLANAGEVHGIEALAETNDEKGKRMKGSRWSKDSIFGALDMEAALYEAVGWQPDFLLCLDGSLEAADFVAVSEAEPALALIHAKQLSGGLSAEKIQVVKAQAVKNLRYLNSAQAFSEHLQLRLRAAWTNGSHKVQRIRKGPFGKSVPTRAEVTEAVDRIVRTPRTRREVWLALGDGFSKAALDAELGDATETNLPAANVIQLAYLLQATNAAVGSVGARFRVLTSP